LYKLTTVNTVNMKCLYRRLN